MGKRFAVAAAVLVAGLLGTAPLLGAAGASTDPSVTKHVTTFDDIAPLRLESDPPVPSVPPFDQGYVPGSVSPCNTFFGIPGVSFPQWTYVGPQPQALDGEVTNAPFVMTDDSPFDHHSRDRNVYIYPYPQSAYLLAAPGNFQTGEESERGRIEMEWESAALPAWATPAWGDHVHVEGGHIWDCAHADVSDGYRTEIHPPLVAMSIRDAADGWPNNVNPVLPTRPGWVDTMPGLGSVPVPVTRADVFGSSDGGEALEQENCFYHPCSVPDWYQPLAIKSYDFFVPAPPKPDQDAQLITKLIKRPFPNCASDSSNHNDCGSLDVLKNTNRITFTNTPTGVAVHVNFDNFTEPQSLLYGFGFTLEVGWNRPAAFIPDRVKVTVEKVHIKTTMDDAGNGPAAEWEIAAMIGDNFKHLLLTETNGDGVGYEWNESVPTTKDVDVGDYGIKGSGPECALQTDSGTDPGPCQKVFEVTLPPGEPLRISFRAEEDDAGANFNNPAGAVERILTDNYAIGQKTEWFQEKSSAGDIELDGDCDPDACASITYKIENDPIPAPPLTTHVEGTPLIDDGVDKWVTSATPVHLTTTAPAGNASDLLEIHARFWRTGTQPPPETICGSGVGTADCTLHLDKQDGQDGQYTIEYWGVDATKGAIERTQSLSFRLDNTAPTSTASISGTFVRGWYNTPVTVTLAASDGTGVGVDHIGFVVDPPGFLLPYSSPFDVSSDSASHTVSASAADKLTNTEPLAQKASFAIDRTPPKLTISDAFDGAFHYTQDELVNGMFTNGSMLQIAYASSDVLSGMWQVRVDGTPMGFSGTTVLSVPSGVSTHTLVGEDVAGNLTTLTFAIVSVTPLANPDPQGAGTWKNVPPNSTLLDEVNIVSRAFGAPTNRFADVTPANYASYLTPGANPTLDQKVARELLVAWLNLVSGREPASRAIDLKTVNGWWHVVTNTGGQNGTSATTALNLVRESERRLEDVPPSPYLDLVQTLLEKLNADKLK
jgi:hypothetical protein